MMNDACREYTVLFNSVRWYLCDLMLFIYHLRLEISTIAVKGEQLHMFSNCDTITIIVTF